MKKKLSEVTKTEHEIPLSDVTHTESVALPDKEKISPLSVSFQTEDLNKVVEKINEIISKCQ